MTTAFATAVLGAKTDAPALSGGLASFRAPTGASAIVRDPHPRCIGCIHREAHQIPASAPGVVVAPGAVLSAPEAEVLDRMELRRFAAALHLLDYIMWGPGPTLPAPAPVVVASFDYEITGVEGSTLSVFGPDPRALAVSNGEYSGTHALPLGAGVVFLGDSVYAGAGRLQPMVLGVRDIGAPDGNGDCAFDLLLNIAVPNAMEPADADEDDPTYECAVRFAIPPGDPRWPRFEPPTPLEVARQEMEFSALEIVDPVRLLDGAGDDTRVLPSDYPWEVHPSGLPLWELEVETSPGVFATLGFPGTMETRQVGPHAWEVDLDLSGLLTDYPSIVGVVVRYWAEAVAEDAEKPRVQVPVGKCLNSAWEPTGSFVHGGGERCLQSEVADGFTDYQPECWQPNCDQWSLEIGGWERSPKDLLDLIDRPCVAGEGDPAAYVDQTLARQGPSLAGMLGLFDLSNPEILPLRTGAFGRRVTGEDAGDFTHRIAAGAYAYRIDRDMAAAPPDRGGWGEALDAAPELRMAGEQLLDGQGGGNPWFPGAVRYDGVRGNPSLARRLELGPGVLAVPAPEDAPGDVPEALDLLLAELAD